MKKLIECVPNFSEGNDMHIIDQITAEIKAVEGVSLIDVDPGKSNEPYGCYHGRYSGRSM